MSFVRRLRFFFSSLLLVPTYAVESDQLSKEELQNLYTNTEIQARGPFGPFKLQFGSIPGCAELSAGNGRYIEHRATIFNKDGSYSYTEAGKTKTSPGVTRDGDRYMWMEDGVRFQVKKLKWKKKKVNKFDKKLAKILDQCQFEE